MWGHQKNIPLASFDLLPSFCTLQHLVSALLLHTQKKREGLTHFTHNSAALFQGQGIQVEPPLLLLTKKYSCVPVTASEDQHPAMHWRSETMLPLYGNIFKEADICKVSHHQICSINRVMYWSEYIITQ